MTPKLKGSKNADGLKKAKTEPGTTCERCVAGLQGKALSNTTTYQLSKAPSHIQEYYETMKDGEKQNFVEKLLSASGEFTDPYFEHMRDIQRTTDGGTVATWISYKQLLEKEDETVAQIMFNQRKIITRPHSKLDHDDPATKAWPPIGKYFRRHDGQALHEL